MPTALPQSFCVLVKPARELRNSIDWKNVYHVWPVLKNLSEYRQLIVSKKTSLWGEPVHLTSMASAAKCRPDG